MARPLRLEFPGALYHVTSRGNARQAIFLAKLAAVRKRQKGVSAICIGRDPRKVAVGVVERADLFGDGRVSGAAQRTFSGEGAAQGSAEGAAVCGPAFAGGDIWGEKSKERKAKG